MPRISDAAAATPATGHTRRAVSAPRTLRLRGIDELRGSARRLWIERVAQLRVLLPDIGHPRTKRRVVLERVADLAPRRWGGSWPSA
jgi:hypothetical protein